MASTLFSEVRNRQLALQLRATLDGQYTAKPSERTGIVMSDGQVLVSNQRYALSTTGTPLPVGSTLDVVNIARPAAALYAPANGGAGGIASGGGGGLILNGETVGGFKISATSLTSGSGANFVALDSGGINPAIYVGSETPSLAPFRVTRNGILYATGAVISGAITGGTLDIGGADATSFHVDVDGNLWSGAAAYASAPFKVSSAGALTAISGALAGWTIDSTRIYTANAVLGSVGYVSFGPTPPTTYGNNVGAWLGYSSGAKLSLYADTNNYFQWDGAKLLFKAANTTLDASGNLTASSVALTGAINASSGTFTGLVQIGNSTPHLHLDGAQALVESSNFASGTSGWRVAADGSAEFENITARGFIKTAVFIKSLVLAFAGSQVVSKSASTVATDCTLSGTTFTLVVRLQAGGAPFANGDLIYIKTETLATYATVNTGSASGGNWSYTATYKSGSNSGTVSAGETVVDYGGNGDGRVWITADSTNAPYLSIATHDMSATPVWTERARLGLLTGIAGASGYGLWTDNGFFSGAISASTIDIGGADATSFHVDVNGNIWSGAATYAAAPFKVSNAGALTALTATVGIVAGGANLLLNSSLQVDANADNIADGWDIYNAGAEATSSTVLTTGGVDNRGFMRITWAIPNTSTKGIRGQNAWGGVQGGWLPNTTYIVSFWAKSPDMSGATQMTLYWATNPATQTDISNPVITTAWQRYIFRITWGASVQADGALYISIVFGTAVYGSLDFDHVQVEQADTPSAWKPFPSELEPGSVTAEKINLNGFLSIGSAGGIYQGTGTAASPTTGLKMWNDSGIGRIGGYNASALQWYAGTDGKMYAGAGNVWLDSSGVNFVYDNALTTDITWRASGVEQASIRTRDLYSAGRPNLALSSGKDISLWPGYGSGGILYVWGDTQASGSLSLGTGLYLTEMTAPGAPAANNLVIYAVDNGAGKTRLMVRFATGVAQQIAIQA
jgi:hypothetical protein